MKLLLTWDHMDLEISKRYSYSFHSISAKVYDINYRGGIQAVTFVTIGQIFFLLFLEQSLYFQF